MAKKNNKKRNVYQAPVVQKPEKPKAPVSDVQKSQRPRDNAVPKATDEKKVSPSEIKPFNVKSPPQNVRAPRFTIERVSAWTIFILCITCTILGYVVPLSGWVYSLLKGTDNPELGNYLTQASAVVGFVSVALGLVSLYKSWQSDKQAAETTRLLRDVQQKMDTLEYKLENANIMLDKMYTTKSTKPSAPSVNGTWRPDEARDVEPGRG